MTYLDPQDPQGPSGPSGALEFLGPRSHAAQTRHPRKNAEKTRILIMISKSSFISSRSTWCSKEATLQKQPKVGETLGETSEEHLFTNRPIDIICAFPIEGHENIGPSEEKGRGNIGGKLQYCPLLEVICEYPMLDSSRVAPICPGMSRSSSFLLADSSIL